MKRLMIVIVLAAALAVACTEQVPVEVPVTYDETYDEPTDAEVIDAIVEGVDRPDYVSEAQWDEDLPWYCAYAVEIDGLYVDVNECIEDVWCSTPSALAAYGMTAEECHLVAEATFG